MVLYETGEFALRGRYAWSDWSDLLIPTLLLAWAVSMGVNAYRRNRCETRRRLVALPPGERDAVLESLRLEGPRDLRRFAEALRKELDAASELAPANAGDHEGNEPAAADEGESLAEGIG